MQFQRKLLITGGAGFIGSHVLRRMVNKYPDTLFVNLDKLTYAGNLENLQDIQNASNYVFVKDDIVDEKGVQDLFDKYAFDGVIHLAAESHVDRSIEDPFAFIRTNILGTLNLLQIARTAWKDTEGKRFYHVSTDEVYGTLGETGLFHEKTPYDPRSPYSASKASSDHLVRAYMHTYNLPIVVSNCSNNYGSHQFPEKLIPLFIDNVVNNKPLPVYGDGKYTRDWLWVEDHAAAIDLIFHEGNNGETYNIGGFNEWKNIDLIHQLCKIMDTKLGRPSGTTAETIIFVKDRAGHDRRYAIDASKLNKDLGWKPSLTFEVGLEKTIDWYLANPEWLQRIRTGEYQQLYKKQFGEKEA